jgi:hypothetical protein
LPDINLGGIHLRHTSGFARLYQAALAAACQRRCMLDKQGDASVRFWRVTPVDFAMTN